jgi:polyribonucleotide nucleotidyltransferase
VTRIANFGAFVEIMPGLEGLLHISEVAEHRVREVQDEIKEGDEILVKVLEVDGDRVRLSRKAVLREKRQERGEELPPEPAREAAPGGGRPQGRDRDRRPFGRGGHHSSRSR